MKIDFLKIKSGFNAPKGNKQGFDSYVSSIEKLVKEMIPKDLFDTEVSPPHFLSYESYFQKLGESLPLIKWSSFEEAPCSISIAILCSAEYTHGTGRFFLDTMARSLIPGKQLPITAIRSLNFRFIIYPKDRYFITEIFIDIENERDLYQIRQALPRLAEEIRLTLLATQHARKIVLAKPLTMDEKRMVLLENLSSLVKRPDDQHDPNILEETHHLLLKVAHHETPSQIPDHLLPLIEERPQAFDHNMFQGIQSLILMFGENMISKRDVGHLYRTLSYLYLFRKNISHRLKIKENEHLISIKVLRTTITPKTPVLAVLICLNFKSEQENLDQKKLIQVIQSHLPYSRLVEDSLITSKDKDRICMLYLEMVQEDGRPFAQAHVKELKKKLPKEIHSLYRFSEVHRTHDANEEEVVRNILTLSKELKTPQDPPPVIIHFASETEKIVTFTVILVCLNSKKIYFENSPHMKVLSHQSKIAGILNKRHLQHAHVLELELEKESFTDENGKFSLYEARKSILSYLKKSFGPMRDFNSGMIVKQYENLSKLKAIVLPTPLVEKFFYSIAPGYMQSLLSTETLKIHYEMLLKSLEVSFEKVPYHLFSDTTDEELLLMMSSPFDELIDQIKQETVSLLSSSTNLTTSDVSINGIRVLGLIFSVEDPSLRQEFLNQIISLIKSLDPGVASTL
ncbi:hypothetical protein [Simkania negevensis]|uniref:Uncharacterized protein n=1 Tax=Simkania negevensis (strain ATCC VR-1471 / DSM 27360 / Z) TaxID=331113 RepID=F8L839_SIMNZ|nr:hypothetical protein [Simkania negevensis]MCB1074624.1 hypothetical protein [Simkania sp.]CCB88946.1 hypothetical protein SNE_A10690 [Simkania negevensis Z]